ncbi:LytR/AlgR family response regulator transcription factor [Sphingobacterium sp. SGR-19]|uniref:LytR/AlgR family response regulator transcription factor n=1 Tax=Sphingobacterium sp. SGR-19 TaxID=2710886 RepID=UPI0013ED739F|nr:LytTR family DNA-binding domain-containing protein [Sphingobacterium sp. SGR-19]NGM65799.1 response regulator transcription factor [Sphingobacterium sp. SGR-19]
MRTLTAIIIDDQQLAIDHILDLTKEIDYVEIVATFTDEKLARGFIQVNPVDFIILDVEMKHTNAFRFLRTLPDPKIPTILYTGHQQYEDQGYERDMVDVLLKPVSESRLMAALRRMHKNFSAKTSADDSLGAHEHYFQIKGPVRAGRQMVRLKELVYVASEGGKIIIHLVDGQKLESAVSFKAVMSKLPRKWFKQCYQNIAFNVNFYAGYREKQVLLTVTDKTLPTGGKDRYTDFYAFVDSNLLED